MRLQLRLLQHDRHAVSPVRSEGEDVKHPLHRPGRCCRVCWLITVSEPDRMLVRLGTSDRRNIDLAASINTIVVVTYGTGER